MLGEYLQGRPLAVVLPGVPHVSTTVRRSLRSEGGSLGRWCDTGRLLFCSKVNKPTNEQWDESGKDSEVMLKRHLKEMITGIAMQELRQLCFMQ